MEYYEAIFNQLAVGRFNKATKYLVTGQGWASGENICHDIFAWSLNWPRDNEWSKALSV